MNNSVILEPALPFDLIVFDWDGTLMDSEARIVACISAAIQDLNLEPRDSQAMRNVIGLGLHEAIEKLYPGSHEPFRLHFIERYRYHFLEADPTPSSLFADSRATVAALQQQRYLLAIATGKGRIGLDQVLEETAMGSHFITSRCADETRSKPHPQMLLEIIETCGVDPRRTLMVGDTEYDLEMGRHAGVATLAVSYGVHTLERLLTHQPNGVIHAISELPAWLANLR
ncbi:MAG: HAD-IA family hydrolase [Gammaproteobacteria bacterium]|nr:HAD-IA family hydrolase [Gammaproteobacteria bacterium]